MAVYIQPLFNQVNLRFLESDQLLILHLLFAQIIGWYNISFKSIFEFNRTALHIPPWFWTPLPDRKQKRMSRWIDCGQNNTDKRQPVRESDYANKFRGCMLMWVCRAWKREKNIFQSVYMCIHSSTKLTASKCQAVEQLSVAQLTEKQVEW